VIKKHKSGDIKPFFLRTYTNGKTYRLRQVSDEQLLGLFRNGDEQAFAQLVKRYEKELYNFLAKFTGRAAMAEDIFQEAFLQVHISAADFDVTRRFRPWLYTIASNKARDAMRRSGRRPAINLTALEDDDSDFDLWNNLLKDETTPQDIFDKKQQQEMVRDVVGQMSDNLREILILAYFNQLTYKEMADALDVPLGTVKSRLHSAVAAFAKNYRQATGQQE